MDIILDDEMDLLIENGDFVIADGEEQHQQIVIIASQGSFRASPLTGVNIAKYIKTGFTQAQIDQLTQKIRIHLQYDGYARSVVKINSFNDIQINAER